MIKNKNTDLIRAIKHHGCNGSGDVTLETLNVTENGEYNSQKGKAWNKVNVNVQGGGAFNINDIILADDLLEKCQALGLQANKSVETDWTFENICTQDSCGVLQNCFEGVVYEEIEGSTVPTKSTVINDLSRAIPPVQIPYITIEAAIFSQNEERPQQLICIHTSSDNYKAGYKIAFNGITRKYIVRLDRGLG